MYAEGKDSWVSFISKLQGVGKRPVWVAGKDQQTKGRDNQEDSQQGWFSEGHRRKSRHASCSKAGYLYLLVQRGGRTVP